MSTSNAHTGEHRPTDMTQIYEFGTDPFVVWSAEMGAFPMIATSQWQFDYSALPPLPQHEQPVVLKHLINAPEVKSPYSATFNHGRVASCSPAPIHGTSIALGPGHLLTVEAQTPVVADMEHGLRIENVTTMTTGTAHSTSPVPAIVTQFPSRTNSVDDAPPDGLLTFSQDALAVSQCEPVRYEYSITPPTMGYPPNSSGSLQEPFQWHSPITRRTSLSSSASGPVFSHLGTPISTFQHETMIATPHSFQHRRTPQSTCSQQFDPRSPQSPNATWKPQSRKHSSGSLSRMSQQYINALQRYRNAAGVSLTMPSRRKPKIEHCLSDSALTRMDNPGSQGTTTTVTTATRSIQGRRRAVSAVHQRPQSAASSVPVSGQLQLPIFQPDQIFASPARGQASFPGPSATIYASPAPSSLMPCYTLTPYLTQEPQPHQMELTPSPTFPVTGRPSDPPASDFQHKPAEQMPIFQAPQFEGDVYTPQYKRRNAKGEWEGWCGLCQPGQWHNLKNSRYWDDKLRNHGICARTKQKFENPTSIRIVDLDGKVVDLSPERDESGELRGDEWVVSGLDGSLRKREGLCGHCLEWIPMDGVRTKAKGKSVGWWSHAYKCHERGRKGDHAEQTEHLHRNASQYLPHLHQPPPVFPHTMYVSQQTWG